MKDVAINLAAAWGGTIKVWQDGDVFRETNHDVLYGAIGDHLGWLKTAVDGKAGLSTSNTWTAPQTFETGAGPVTITNDGDDFICNAPMQGYSANFSGEVNCNEGLFVNAGLHLKVEALPDAASAIDAKTFHARVPVITANRVYTLPAATGLIDGKTMRIERLDTSSAWSATLQDPTGPTTMGIVGASAAGWIEVIKRGSNWRVSAWGGSVTSLHSTP